MAGAPDLPVDSQSAKSADPDALNPDAHELRGIDAGDSRAPGRRLVRPAVLSQHARLRTWVHQQPLVLVAVGGMLGILLASFFPSIHWLGQVLWATILLTLTWWIWRGGSWGWALAATVFLPLMASRHLQVVARYQSASIQTIASSESQPAILEVMIDRPIVMRRHPLAGLPNRRDSHLWQSRFEATVRTARVGTTRQPMTGRVQVISNGPLNHLGPGDRVQVFGSIRAFSGPTNPGEQDLRRVYQRRGLHATVDVDSQDQLVRLPSSAWRSTLWWLPRKIGSFAAVSRDLLLQHTSESAGPLAVALVIGQRDFVDNDTRDQLLVTGTAHLLSVSGLHLAIIVLLAKQVSLLMRWTPRFEIVWILSVSVLYVAITGGRPPVLRAAVLVAALMTAVWLRRPSQPINSLAFAALLLLYYNPQNLLGVGVMLSFLAVATLVLCGQPSASRSPAIERSLQKEEQLQRLSDSSKSVVVRWGRYCANLVWQMVWFSACVTATSIPLVWYHFHVVSPISVATNVCLSPLLVFALASGVGTVMLGLISATLGDVMGSVCSLFLESMQGIIDFCAALPLGHAWLPSPPAYWIALFYIVLIWSLTWKDHRWATITRRSWILVWGIVAWWMATTPMPLQRGSIEATFVDVGHGTSVVLRFAEDDVWLYDCGRLGNEAGSSRDIDSALWSLGVTRLSGIVLSHADTDHYNALPGLLKRFKVDQIITPPGMLAQDEAGALDAARAAIAKYSVTVKEASAGDKIVTSGFSMDVMHPPLVRVDGNDNANSLVLNIGHAGRALLLPGDLEPPGTEALINQTRPSPGGILMAPHHGSLTMNAEAVLQWARPQETVVSGGQRAKRPEVAEMLAVTGSGVHNTAQDGAVQVTIRESGVVVIRRWHESGWQNVVGK